MKILLTTGELIDKCYGHLFGMNLGIHIDRYRQFGEIVCICNCQETEKSKYPKLPIDGVEYVFTPRINTLKSLFYDKKGHDKIIHEQMQRNDIDMAILHVPSDNAYCAAKYARKYGKPYMIVVVGCGKDALWNYDWRGKCMAPYAYFRQKYELKHAPYALYVTKKFLQQRYPCDGITEYASDVCLADMDDSVLEQRIARINKYTEGDALNIVTTAAVDVRYKGQEYVIRAIAELNRGGTEFHYYLVGGGDNSYLRKLAISLGIENYVHFVGTIPNKEVFSFMDQMDIYIQSSKLEGLPRALVEAMSRALPAIGTRIGGIPELLPDEYLVRAGSVDDILDVLSTCMNKESMKIQAQTNFATAKEYQIDILNGRRNEFIERFIEQK